MLPKRSLLVGLGVPVVGVLGGLPLVSDTDATVAGMPLLFFWLFAWCPLTSVCLWLCWWLFDRHDYPADEQPADGAPR